MSTSKIQRRSGLESWDTENMIQSIKAVCNKEMGHLAAAKNIICLVLHFTITFAQIGTLLRPPSQNWGVCQLFLQLVEYLLLIEQKFSGCTRDDVRSLPFHLAVQNKIPSLFSITKEAAGKDWFKRCMKRHSDKLSLRQPTGKSIV
jgi:hypothetical protein